MFDYLRSKVKNRGSGSDGTLTPNQQQLDAQTAVSNQGRRSSQQALPSAQANQIQTSQTMRPRVNSQPKAARSADPNVTYSQTLESDDHTKYDVTQVYTFVLEPARQKEAYYETSFDILDSDDHWELDDRLIDYDMLQAQPEDADRIFAELKKRALAQKKKEKAREEVDFLLELEDEGSEDESESSVEILGSAKILELIKGYTKSEREDFTNNLLSFANKKDKRQIDILLPALKELAVDEFADIKKALLNQFTPLVALISENFGEMGYQIICRTVFPLLDELLYDDKADVRDRAIQVVAEIRTVVKDDWKEHVMRLALNLAHDEQDKLRESAIKLLNEVSADMGQQINECYVVNEFRALGLDEQTSVRCTLAQNLTNVSKNISTDVFSQQLFPLYDDLTQDKEWKVRKACADVVAQIAEVTPMDRDASSLQKLYYRFLLDPSSKIVRGTAFQNIGPFIATLKDNSTIDQRITDFFVNTTMKTNNKDVCYYASFNFPAFIWVTGKDEWHKFRALYNKLTSVSDIQTQRTLSCSLHEIARILGPELTDSDLLGIADRFLRHNNPDVRLGIMKNLHVLLAEVPEEKRQSYIQYITQTFNEAGAEWRTKEMLAKNLGKFASLFDRRIVYSEFLPMFFKFCEDRVATVSGAAATALAPILNKFSEDRDQQKAIIKIVKNNFRYGQKASFKRRQLFIIMCEEVMNLAKDIFDEYFKHDMLSLAADRVVNVRLTLARALKNHFRMINCTFMHDPLVNQAVKVLLNDKSQDVIDLVQDIVQFQTDLEDSSQSSQQSNDHDTALTSFMDTLTKSRRSSSAAESDISEMEDEIMQKSGIALFKNREDLETAPEANQQIQRQDTPAVNDKQARPVSGNFVSGTEEDLNVAMVEDNEDDEDGDALEKHMEEQFEQTLEKREDYEESSEAKVEEPEQSTVEESKAEATVEESQPEEESTSQPTEEGEEQSAKPETEAHSEETSDAPTSEEQTKSEERPQEEEVKSDPAQVEDAPEESKEEAKAEEESKVEEAAAEEQTQQESEATQEASTPSEATPAEEESKEEATGEEESKEEEAKAEEESKQEEAAAEEQTQQESEATQEASTPSEATSAAEEDKTEEPKAEEAAATSTAETATTETSEESTAAPEEKKQGKAKLTKEERKRMIQEKLAAKKKKEEEEAAATNASAEQ